jgi:predicted DNA-binding transcriptional regulator AlpA
MPGINTTSQRDLFTETSAAPKHRKAVPKPVPEPTCTKCRETYLSVGHVASRFGVSRAAIWRWAAGIPDFPSPLKVTRGTTRWKLSELVRFETTRGRQNLARKKSNMNGEMQ